VNGAVELCYSKISEPDEIRNINTKLLIVADGAKSDTRNLLGIESTTKDYGQVAIVSNITLSQNHNNIAYERFTDSGPLAMLPLRKIEGHNRSALVWTVFPAQAQKLLALTEADFLNELQLAFGFRLGKFTGASRRHSYPVRLTTSKEQVRSNIVVVGNAAHALHPVAGQGFNLALRDIAALTDILAKSVTEGKILGEYRVLENYIKHQKIDQNRTIFLSDFLPTVFGSTSLLVKVSEKYWACGVRFYSIAKKKFRKNGYGSAH
jgi:ubiquinone biosynthesis UbiH/UbiF/VisC/COQ6 family hydroxylase